LSDRHTIIGTVTCIHFIEKIIFSVMAYLRRRPAYRRRIIYRRPLYKRRYIRRRRY
jgi:hypothetical protein